MQIKEKKHNYLADNQSFSFKEKLANGVIINAYVVFDSDKFLEYQKDLLQDFLAEFIDKSNTDIYDETDLKNNLEDGLQSLNTNLRKFSDKVTDVDRFTIKGYIQIIAGTTIMASMIGDISFIMFRNKRLNYQLHNGFNKKSKIDIFSDFIEGDIQTGDELLYIGTKLSDVLDQSDINEMENILSAPETSFIEFIEKLVTARVEKENIALMSNYHIYGNVIEKQSTSRLPKIKNPIKINTAWTKRILANKYYITILVLSIVILVMLYSVLSQLLNTSKDSVFKTSDGVIVDITIDDIKKDILLFKQMDPSSDQKGVKYSQIIEKLNLLESKGRWLEDVENLKGIIEDDYYKGFNIIRLESLSKLDDPATGIKTRVLSLNNTEKTKVGDVLFIDFQRGLNIGGTKGAMIGVVNDGSRGSLVEFNIDSDIQGCSSNLLRDGLYCYTKDGRIFSVNKAGVEPLITSDPAGFPDTIGGVGVYGKANLYVFQSNLNNSRDGAFVTRYRNIVGSQVSYQGGENYSLMAGYESGVSFSGDFGDVAIDSTFLTWNAGKLYQLRRPGYGVSLDVREIKLLGGDTITNKYSDDIKVIAYLNSKYVYLFDRINKTFTIYTSNPLKTNDQYNTQFKLYYLFSFKFDLSNEKVLDISISENSGNKPEMYILTNEGVNKVNLYEYIDSLVNDDTLKAIGGGEAPL
ncbi:MAG TPA: hypothetical protein PK674_02265 [Candidatus Absconditabacterales bacterium]|nr:hypothetical protein [Candidatus Absconditabacterales bacterium]HPK27663.1 hypothetical protein [Candidatus Absconditabacterales bacterium]